MFHTENFNLRDFFALKAGIGNIHRNKKTKHYNYADLQAITEAIAPNLGDRWVFQDYVNGLTVGTRLYDLESDTLEYIESTIEMVADLDGQDTGKLVTYYRRYNRTVLLDLVTEDNDAAAPKRATTKRTSSRRRRTEQEVY